MQRVCYAAGLMPDAFWSSTFDEVLLVYKSYNDRLRFYRKATKLLHESLVGSKDAVDIFEYLPLPYDEEINGGATSAEDLRAEYEYLKKMGA